MDLYYEVHGNGHPVVLIHSGGADLRDWTFVAPLLARHHMVVTFDGRGAGKSPDPVGDVNCVEDLKDLLDHLNIHKVTLIGHSMGGQIATDFSLEYPEYVSELVLIAPALSGFNYSSEFVEYMNKINAAAPDIDKMIEISQSAPLYRAVQASPHKDLTEQMLRHHIKRTWNWPAFEMIWPKPLAAERLGELTVKTLFIIGTEELPDNLRVADYFRKHSDARIVEIHGSDHMVTLTHPEDLYRHIIDFMEE
ncbi:alpha/beta fold hydrolase [Thermoflavimicrobium daqui]|uniref:Alpha/beta hydrolase n=1 Tax=Thermoflavimicrobium daqui TaxID=2137476 RepID=A0A364K1N7_9BACL|nr:alpha/beta hydrolase [Thermoflavimicrobium daqui]RAL21948.1 alpha/beta hydrolase [Thermoflavimicrobium daqui]